MPVNHSHPKERASDRGIAILIGIMKFTGPMFIKLLVVPVSFYYFLVSPDSRRASVQYLNHLRQFKGDPSIDHRVLNYLDWWFAYRHMLSFSRAMVDRVYSWTAESGSMRYEVDGQELLGSALGDNTSGGIIFVSHLGNFDLAIARRHLTPGKHFSIVMDTSRTRIYSKYRNRLFRSAQISFIEPKSITPLKTMELVERVRGGEIIVIAADRAQEPDEKNSVCVDFLGESASFPSGPYILAHVLEVPVYTLFVLQGKGKCFVRLEQFEQRIRLSRNARAQDITTYAQKFATRLQKECLAFPLQWYNFYNFWARPKAGKS